MAKDAAPSTTAVIVMCNLPHGLICQVGDKRVFLRGSAHYMMPNPKRKFKNPEPESVVFGATMNLVEKKFWDSFVAMMTDPVKYPDGFGPFKSKAITWNTNKNDATAQRQELEHEKTGFEQAVPDEFGVAPEDQRPVAQMNPLLM